MAIDLHTHYFPAELAQRLRQRNTAPRIEKTAAGERLVMPVGTLSFDEAYVDMDARLAWMDRTGIRRQLLSLAGLFGIDSLPLDESAELAGLFNDDLAALCQRHPERFAGLAALPLADIDAALAEFRRACARPGMLGAILPINGFATLAHAQRYRPLFALANELGAHLFLHPGPRPDEVEHTKAPTAGAPRDQELARRALEVQTDVGAAMITLLLSDFLDGYPNTTVQVANLGGTFAAVLERMDHMVRLRDPQGTVPSSRVRGRVYVDCSSLGAIALEQAVAVYGADRVVLGTDCPIFSAEWTLEGIRDARLSEAERRLILEGNALRLLEREAG